MKTRPFILALMISATGLAATQPMPPVTAMSTAELHRPDVKTLTPEKAKLVTEWSVKFLHSANFNTATKPEILKQSVATIQQHYRQTVAGEYLVITYATPVVFNTIGGDVTVVEIVVGLNRKDDVPSALFTIDGDGRVVAFEKYAGVLPAELLRAAPATTTSRAALP